MGSITYDNTVVEFEDRLLTHLQVVVIRKFRAGEALLMSWLDPLSIGDGRSSMWLTPNSPLHFTFAGSRAPSIDREWLDALTASADKGSGLIVTEADGRLARALNQYPAPTSRR